MEAANTRPHRLVRPSSYRETTFSEDPLEEPQVTTTDVEDEVDADLISNLENLNLQITQQEDLLRTNQLKVKQKKAQAKEDVGKLFSLLHEVLKRKEEEIFEKVDIMYDGTDRELTETTETLKKLKDSVDEMVDKHKLTSVTNDMLRSLHGDTLLKLHSNHALSSPDHVPEIEINSEAQGLLENLNYADFSTTQISSDSERNVQELTNENEIQGVVSSLSDREIENEEDEGNSEDTVRSDECTNRSSTGSTEVSSMSSVPSAPPLDLYEGEVVPEDPPPYWQAMGLPGPVEGACSANIPPLNVIAYSDPAPMYTEIDTGGTRPCRNVPELWHSFPLRRQHDTRTPLYVAMSWEINRICLADRNNKKVKFFSPTGEFLNEMYITSGEIHDVAFLEMNDGVSRYIITLPRERVLLIVAVMEDNSTTLVRKIVMKNFYSSICRGPKAQTLVGAVTNPGNAAVSCIGRPRVEMFDFTGRVLQTFQMTRDFIEFQYPRSVEVFGDVIIVMDWKLCLVATFHIDGSLIGQYKGTPTSPLINPQGLTHDTYGNIMIVDGEFSNIHVITLECIPLEVLKLPKSGSEVVKLKNAAFDSVSQRLAVVNSKGSMAVYSFQNGYKDVAPHETLMNTVSPLANNMPPETLPFVEGMLPTTIANVNAGRSRNRHRTPQFFL